MHERHFTRGGSGATVVLSHSLGCDLRMWDDVCVELEPHCSVLRYDDRGHGQSAPAEPPLTIADLADDALALIERECAGEPIHFVGLSLGGMVAQALAARQPRALASVVIANSSSLYDDAAKAQWRARIETVRAQGLAPIADGVMQRWFTPEFRVDERGGGAALVRQTRERLEGCDPASYAACCEAVANIDLRAGNARVGCPTLVIAGRRDEATPPSMSQAIANEIAGAKLRTIDAAHLSAVERPREFAAMLMAFWGQL
ncbi:MAG: alpha/beta fold hydrolase [Burkholderiales bacterium]